MPCRSPSRRLACLAAAAGALVLATAQDLAAKPATGEPAPGFTATATSGAVIELEALRGRIVVLEWTNHECPYVRKHYDPARRSMQTTQAEAAAAGAVWLSVVSSAPGKQGHVDAASADGLTASRGASPAHVILDPEGSLGRLYDARTTPHMFVIDEKGILAYQGAIDSIASGALADLDAATNYVRAALAELKDGRPVSTPESRPYGCSVKY